MLARFEWMRPWARKNYNAFLALVDPTQSVKSGARVDLDSALAVSTVLACVRVLSEGIGQMPFKLYRETKEGSPEVASDHRVYKLLHRRPNSWQTPFEFREGMVAHAVLTGNAYAWKNIVRGEVRELIPLVSTKVKPVQDDLYQLRYEVERENGGKWIIPREQMFHLRGLSWDSYSGLNALRLAREAIGLAITTEETHARLHQNGARPGGILSLENGRLSEEQLKQLRVEWEKTQGGVANAMKTALLTGGWKYQSMAMTGVDAQHIETRKFQIEEICRALRVFPLMVMHADKTATFASAEQFFIAHVMHSLDPWAVRLEQAADRDLLSEQDIEAGHFAKMTREGLLRGAARDRAEFYTKALGAGGSPAWMTQDEVRGLENLPRMGGAAAVLPKPTNVAPGGDEDPDPGPDEGTDKDAD